MSVTVKLRILAVIPIALTACFLQAQSELSVVKLYTEQEVEMQVEEYRDPILFEHGKVIEDPSRQPTTRPVWCAAYYAFYRLDEYRFDQWRMYVTDDLISSYKLTAEAFREHQAKIKQDRDRYSHAKSTAFYAVYIKFDGRELCEVVTYNFDHVRTLPKALPDLKYGASFIFFEKLEGNWRMQDPSKVGWIIGLPHLQVEKIRAIISAGSAVLGKDKQVRPFDPRIQ